MNCYIDSGMVSSISGSFELGIYISYRDHGHVDLGWCDIIQRTLSTRVRFLACGCLRLRPNVSVSRMELERVPSLLHQLRHTMGQFVDRYMMRAQKIYK